MSDSETEIVDPLSNDEQIRAVLDQFAASHQTVEAKPVRRAAKKKDTPVERELEPGESLPSEVFDGMALGDDDGDEDEEEDVPQVHRKPKPDAGQKGDIWSWYEKFKIGIDPEMSIQLVRVYPKIFPNGVIAEGPLDTFPTPIDEAYVASTYGGGKYEIHAMGPGKNGHGRRRFSQFTMNIPGVADSSKPSSLVRDITKGEVRMQAPPPAAPSENVGVVQQALKTLEKTSDDAQKRARALEDRFYSGAASSVNESMKMTGLMREEFEKREHLMREQAEKEQGALRAQAEKEERVLEERLRERDKQIDSLREQVQTVQNSMPSTFKEIVELVRNPSADRGSQEMMNSLLTKHAAEVEAMRTGFAREVEASRSAHLREIESMRQSHERDRDGDRREAASREQRVLDQLEQAREERRRDQQMHKDLQEQRDTSSRDREQGRVDLIETMWQARLRSADESMGFRVNAMSAETERLRGEVAELRSKVRDEGDVYSQIERAKSLMEIAGGGGGLAGEMEPAILPQAPSAAPKGIIEQVVEYGPMIGKIVGDLVNSDIGKKKPRREQPQPPMGAVINTPQGRMVVTPQGLVPEYLYAQAVQPQQQQPRMFQQPQPQRRLQQQQQPQRQQRPQRAQQAHEPREPQPPPHWQQPQQPQVRRTSRPQDDAGQQDRRGQAEAVVVAPNIYEAQEQMAGAKEPLSGTVASFVAKALDDGLNSAMEVDEFINAIREKVPEAYLQDLVKYTSAEVVASVRQHVPRSLVLSPGGLEFTDDVMRRLRAMYGIAS